MINLSFTINNPFTEWKFKNLYNKTTTIKNKEIEFEFLRTNLILQVEFSFLIKCDHPGIFVEIGFMGYNICIRCNDTRHYNPDTNKYY